jgi:hypothetical protein
LTISYLKYIISFIEEAYLAEILEFLDEEERIVLADLKTDLEMIAVDPDLFVKQHCMALEKDASGRLQRMVTKLADRYSFEATFEHRTIILRKKLPSPLPFRKPPRI